MVGREEEIRNLKIDWKNSKRGSHAEIESDLLVGTLEQRELSFFSLSSSSLFLLYFKTTFSMSALEKFLSTPELWFNGVFNFLPFSSIETLSIVSKLLRSSSKTIIHPSHLGIYPVGFWSSYVLPLLSYEDLKIFQRVSQVARKLTLTKKVAKNLFRSDVNLKTLKRIESGMIEDQREYRYGEIDKGDNLPAINPLLYGKLAYSTTKKYEEVRVRSSIRSESRKTNPKDRLYIEDCKAIKENATEPAVPMLQVEGFGEGLVRSSFQVYGTGRSFYGGKRFSVTCEDVMRAFVKDGQRYLHTCKCWIRLPQTCRVKVERRLVCF